MFAGAAAAFAVHVVLAVTYGSLLGLLPHMIVQLAVTLVFLGGAVLVAALAMIVMAGFILAGARR